MKEYDGELETFSRTRFEEDFQSCKSFLTRSVELSKNPAELEDSTRLNLKLLQAELHTFIDGYPFCG